MPKAIRDPARLFTCPWCSERKTASQMRYPGILKGAAPPACAACREAHPDQSWCSFHEKPHPAGRFRLYGGGRPGYFYICRDAQALKAARTRGKAQRVCKSCGTSHESWFFRGGRNKSAVCRHCEDERPEERWCVGCDAWLPKSAFTVSVARGRFHAARCKPCHTANAHGTTVAEILRIQGVAQPECASCGSAKDLKVDHNHDCCPTQFSNGCCIRGYLCHECNTAEGLLRTAKRARQLARYMSRWAEVPKRPEPLARLGVPNPDADLTLDPHPVQRALW